MIDVEATILAIINHTGGNELAIITYTNGELPPMIAARTTGTHATWIHKQGTGTTVYGAIATLADRMGIEAPQVPLPLDEGLCESCGLTLDRVNGVWLMHPECDPNPDERAAYQALGDRV